MLRSRRATRRSFSIGWPERYPHPGASYFGTQLLEGLRRSGEPVDVTPIQQPALGREPKVLVASVRIGDRVELVALDHDDGPGVVDEIADRVLVYFKQQYAVDGYDRDNVVPAGYTPANNVIYRYLPLLRAMRTHGPQRIDVYGRFGLLYGGQALRRHAFDLLSERSDFGHEVSLFRYPGGPDKIPYRRYLFEVARAKVCVDLPGKGDLTTRLIDYLAIGSCVVRPPPGARLPVGLIDGVHVVYCSSDLADLGDICAELVRDTSTRELIAENARDYFDRHLHREQIAHYHVAEITDAAARAIGTHAPVAVPHELEHPVRKPVGATRLALAVAAALLVVLVVLPELFGDRPYNPLGRNSRHTLRHTSLPQPAAPWQLDGRRSELSVDVGGGPPPPTMPTRA